MSLPSLPRVRVKICGVTNREDAEAAVELGADALGFNIWPGSKRCIALDAEAVWLVRLPPYVSRVAVMVNPSVDEARRVASLPFIDALQLHGDETPAFCATLARERISFLKAIALGPDATGLDPAAFGADAVLLDAFVAGAYGGTGKLIDLPRARAVAQAAPGLRVVLSGGLRPDNVAEAIREVRPFAVDVASGIESAPGRKDHRLMASFIAAVAGA